MPQRKKNQNVEYYSEKGQNSMDNSSSFGTGLTSTLEEHENHKKIHNTTMQTAVIVGLLAGLVGGVAGNVYLTPWYEQYVLKHPVPSKTSGSDQKNVVLEEGSAIISAVDKVNAAVVSIVITKDLPKFEQYGSPFGGFFFEAPTGETEKQQIGAGSGFIISADGLIVTNKHVVADEGAEYTVVTKDGEKYPAKVLARDSFNDLAVVKIEAKNMPSVELGDSGNLKLGQQVIAIGNALGEFQNTVTTGVISGIGRNITASGGAQTEQLSELLQTDAAINPGNSGGPLVNIEGQVIGVNTAVSQSAQSIGFAIPINQVKKAIDDVKKYGKIRRAFLGVRYSIITLESAKADKLARDYGALIVKGDNPGDLAIVPGSPADQVGLSGGDIILEVDGEKIGTEHQLSDTLSKYNPGDKVILKVYSKDREKTVLVTLGEAQ